MQIAEIISGPEILFIGANGRKTYGIKVRALQNDAGYRNEWHITDTSILEDDGRLARGLGLSAAEVFALQDEIRALVAF